MRLLRPGSVTAPTAHGIRLLWPEVCMHMRHGLRHTACGSCAPARWPRTRLRLLWPETRMCMRHGLRHTACGSCSPARWPRPRHTAYGSCGQRSAWRD